MDNRYNEYIYTAAKEYVPEVDWRILKAQYWQESRFKPDAVSPVGAMGVAQIMPATWKQWAPRARMEDRDPFDAEASIFVGACYMGYLYGQWSSPRPHMDRVCLALASYNAGLGHLLSAQRRRSMHNYYGEIIKGLPEITGQRNSHETIDYVKKILGFYSEAITG